MRHIYPVFLSSLCKAAPGLWELRLEAFEKIGSKSTIYVDEQVEKRDIPNQDDLAASDELIMRIRESDDFVCILAGCSHGSPINVNGFDSRTSFFEIELFQAALLRKKIHLLVRDDFTPNGQLENILRMLKNSFPEWINAPRLSDKQILDEIQLITEGRSNIMRHGYRLAFHNPIGKLVQSLYSLRAREPELPQITFLESEIDSYVGAPRTDLIQSVFREIEANKNEEKKLSRIWLGLRELLIPDYMNTADPELFGYFNRLLDEWVKAGSWYGLHGHTPLGCLAALNTLTRLRAHISTNFKDYPEVGDTYYPGGALASAKYSIAKRLYVKRDREACFSSALKDLNFSMNDGTHNQANLLAIRGSIMLHTKRVSECINDYENVLKIRRENSAKETQIGEALTELGYAYVMQLSVRKGLRLCEEGVEKMRAGVRPGFLSRALRKLAVSYFANGKIIKAYNTYEESKHHAIESAAFDQLNFK